jgi:hypothetical protein
MYPNGSGLIPFIFFPFVNIIPLEYNQTVENVLLQYLPGLNVCS